jgi:Tfp pilus assembly protein PilF
MTAMRAGAMLLIAALGAFALQVPPSAIEANSQGVGYMNQYLYTEAADAFRKALAADPGLNLARVNLAIALFYKQEYDEATKLLADAAAREPKNASAHYMLGLIAKNQGELEAAEQHFLKVVELDPKDAAALYNLGVTRVRLRKTAEGEADLRRSLELDAANTSVLYNLGSLLVKSGKTEEGNQILERFRALQQKGDGSSIGNQYGEAGDHALAADYRPVYRAQTVAARAPNAAAPFADRSKEAGLAALSHKFMGGIALADLDGDGDIDAVVVTADSGAVLLLNDGKGHFTDATSGSGIPPGEWAGAALGDYDNDGFPDVYLVGSKGTRLLRNLKGGRFEDVTERSGTAYRAAFSATFVDYDHDGDLDLWVSGPSRMYRNNGDGTFTEVSAALGVSSEVPSLGMIATDFDNDRDIDLVVLRYDATPQLFSNERNDRFADVSARARIDAAGPATWLTVADFNRDGAMDWLVGRAAPAVLLANRADGTFEADARAPELLRGSELGLGTGALDFDNDGDLDVYVMKENGGELWENTGNGRFVFAGRLPIAGGRAAAAADLDGDGHVDLLCNDGNGKVRLLLNEHRGANHWLGVRLEGLRSNKMGLGAKVEVRAGALYQKFEISGHNGHLSQDPPVVWIGLGAAKQADSVTVRWPSGILQSEVRVAADRVLAVKELDRKGTSCPLLYTWNGREFEFVTDFLGGCAIGYLEAPGRYSIPDTDEYVRIEGRQLVPRDGKLLLNLNNQLEEVILFDEAELLAVDHPRATEVYPNERLMPAPPFPEFKLYSVSDARPPVRAADDAGRDILPEISALDRVYPADFRSLRWKGYAETHAITLDLGTIAGGGRALLLMDAWIDYADSSSNLAASHAGVEQIPPYLEVPDGKSGWKTAIPSLGFPAGLPKTMTVDVSGKLAAGDPRVRIVTNMKIYWDRIRVATEAPSPARVTRLAASSADLHFRGYPAYYTPDGKLPWIYDYRRIASSELWGTHAGSYTRFGDVRELLAARDDKFVITRHGDEISLEFDAARLPALPHGWTRDYLLYADGYGKDMDLNSLYPEVVGPLPFHAMTAFPYPASEHYPDDEPHREYRRTYNTRTFPVRATRAVPTGN